MRKLNLHILGGMSVGPVVATADEQPVKLVKDGHGGLFADVETEAEEFTLKIFTYLDIRGPLWFFSSLFYFFVGLFGIFDRIENKKCRCVSVVMKVTPTGEHAMTVDLATPAGSQLAARIESDAAYTVSENVVFIDTVARKRIKIMRFVKVLAFLASVAGLIALLVYFLSRPR